jgi:hypothetical protein
MSFGPISALGSRFKSSIRLRRTCGLKLGPALTLKQNPIFEMASKEIAEAVQKELLCAGLKT